jgi:hypothetical protein
MLAASASTPPWQENCQSCVIASDRALAAGEQTELAYPRYNPAYGHHFNWPKNVEDGIGNGNRFRPVQGYDDIMRELLAGGDGARGVVHGGRLNRQGVYVSGHLFNAVNRGGTVYFVDGQTGGWARLESFGLLEFLRTA